ncbi:MAG: DNA-binding protein [Candidatus Omnitrophota bacterium]|jgi:hypothetical protein
MKINYKICPVILFLILIGYLGSPVFSQGISSSELIKGAKEYDTKTVTFTGEAIGDVMIRGEFAWVNINDGENSLGVWMSASLAREIKFTGSYETQGDRLEVTGRFNRACLEHGGDLDIHVQKLRKISPGMRINRILHPGKKNLSLILFGALFLIWILTLFRHK